MAKIRCLKRFYGFTKKKTQILPKQHPNLTKTTPKILLPSAVHLEERLFFVSGRLGSKQWGGKPFSGQAVAEW